jgi:hypothetical protein
MKRPSKKLHMAVPMIEGPCAFSQSGSNVYVDDFNYYKFAFPSAEQGKTYERYNRKEESLSHDKADTP